MIADSSPTLYETVAYSTYWEYNEEKEDWSIYWNYWDLAWPFASVEHKKNPWKWDPDFDDWYVMWDDIAAIYSTCWD